ncbi:glycoside hydrolase family protein [Rhodobium gokarnense]|uniref:Lysozyme n=1 Tax=Rhodobium gokarnense TaxID=364296 RepID=A0ABT3HAH0_9HYPH|nr:peptidoglycan-binding protein [Rhodobium gokarnense]MCW2307391.1 GH24 family phage-related lysozyme (muramidase) [Rhodobium gokarnense]
MSFCLSPRGAAFLERREGFVANAYRDAVGVVTIGTGFTDASRIFRAYWQETRGHRLRMGDTITRAENARLLSEVADGEYGAAVTASIRPKEQHHYDGATSVAFNLGKGSVAWRWAQALRDGDPARCAALLRVGYNTAGGRRLAGLVARRRLEAALIEHGDYADGGPNGHSADGDDKKTLADYQKLLKDRGFDPGPADGLWGPKTRAAVLAFQRSHDGLANDGILGPATKAALDRGAVATRDARSSALAAGLATAAGGAVSAGSDTGAPAWVLAVVATVIAASLAYVLWRNGDEIARRLRGLGHA